MPCASTLKRTRMSNKPKLARDLVLSEAPSRKHCGIKTSFSARRKKPVALLHSARKARGLQILSVHSPLGSNPRKRQALPSTTLIWRRGRVSSVPEPIVMARNLSLEHGSKSSSKNTALDPEGELRKRLSQIHATKINRRCWQPHR